MNPIPSLSTDNLYKFCAIAGLVLFIFAAGTAFQLWRDLLRKQISVNQERLNYQRDEILMKLEASTRDPAWVPDGGYTSEREKLNEKIRQEAAQRKTNFRRDRKKASKGSGLLGRR